MGRHTDSQDAVLPAFSDVTTITGSSAVPEAVSRRQMRESDASDLIFERSSATLDSVSVSNLVAEIVSKADAAIARRIYNEVEEMRVAAAANALAALSESLTSNAVVAPSAFLAPIDVAAPSETLERHRLEQAAILNAPEAEAVNVPVQSLVASPASVAPPAFVVSPAYILPPNAHLASMASMAQSTPAATSRKASRQAQAPRPVAPRVAAPRTAPPRGIAASVTHPHSRRRMTARFLSMTAMVFVAAIAVATSVPANALLSAQDVENRNGAASQNLVIARQNGQSVEASGANVVAGRDGVSVTGAPPVKAYTDASSNRIFPVVPESSGPILWPFPSPVPLTDGYGSRANFWTWGGWTGNFHSGQDFDPGYGTPIQAVADGIVVEVSSNLCGQAVVVSHNVLGEKFDSEYCHMIYGSPNVIVGQSITAGTIVGNVGQTGMATGPHLHLEIHLDGNAIDPIPFLRGHSREW